jgi:GT2 family glycosyltransferase
MTTPRATTTERAMSATAARTAAAAAAAAVATTWTRPPATATAGATAAAALYLRKMIDDTSIDGEFFDPDFFVYREDADVAWRAQLLGWRCMYTPDALAYHVRNVLPGKRRALPSAIKERALRPICSRGSSICSFSPNRS